MQEGQSPKHGVYYRGQQASQVRTNRETKAQGKSWASDITKAHACIPRGIPNVLTEAREISHTCVSIFFLKEKTWRQNDIAQSTAEARLLEKSKWWWNLIRKDWDINTALKNQYRNDRVTYHECTSTLTNKQDKQERSICKAEGATSQILVANALKYLFLQITLRFEKSSMQILQQNWR